MSFKSLSRSDQRFAVVVMVMFLVSVVVIGVILGWLWGVIVAVILGFSYVVAFSMARGEWPWTHKS